MKTCHDCKEAKPHSEFNRKGAGYQGRCRECQKAWYKEYYTSSPKEKTRLLKSHAEHRDRMRALIREEKSVPCADCGVVYPYYVMDFDHQQDKSFTIARVISNGSFNINKLIEEIAKCQVVCSNCHRERTHSWRLTDQDEDAILSE